MKKILIVFIVLQVSFGQQDLQQAFDNLNVNEQKLQMLANAYHQGEAVAQPQVLDFFLNALQGAAVQLVMNDPSFMEEFEAIQGVMGSVALIKQIRVQQGYDESQIFAHAIFYPYAYMIDALEEVAHQIYPFFTPSQRHDLLVVEKKPLNPQQAFMLQQATANINENLSKLSLTTAQAQVQRNSNFFAGFFSNYQQLESQIPADKREMANAIIGSIQTEIGLVRGYLLASNAVTDTQIGMIAAGGALKGLVASLMMF